MCTIGFLYADGAVYTFKQCDLTKQTLFYDPEIMSGTAGRYMAFRRDGRPGIWAGVNQSGVSFVAADYYTNSDPGTPDVSPPARFLATNTHLDPNDDVDRLFKAYEFSIASYANARSAISYLANWYLSEGNPSDPQHPNFKYPDIALLADGKEGMFLEYYPGDDQKTPQVKTLSVQAQNGWFASTNHARMFTQTVDYPKNHSTYLRLARAEALLNLNPTTNGIKSVLRDQYYGQTELSICRVANAPGEYYTQATVILGAGSGSAGAEYLINGNPRTKPYTVKGLQADGLDAPPAYGVGEALATPVAPGA